MLKRISVAIGYTSYRISNMIEKCRNQYILGQIKTQGECHIGEKCTITHPKNVEMGSNVWIGNNCLFMCAKAKIILGSHIMLAPNVSIVTGDHRIDLIGTYMDKVTEKLEKNDQPVIIEDDVWIGTNVTILKGVTIGRGSVIGAGSIITRAVPPYSICYPNATYCKRKRFSDEEIITHEKLVGKTGNIGG